MKEKKKKKKKTNIKSLEGGNYPLMKTNEVFLSFFLFVFENEK